MHHVTFGELALSRVEDLSAGNGRIDRKQGQHILELVPEAKCSARLIECRSVPRCGRRGSGRAASG